MFWYLVSPYSYILLLQAIDGFLLVLDKEGNILYVSETITDCVGLRQVRDSTQGYWLVTWLCMMIIATIGAFIKSRWGWSTLPVQCTVEPLYSGCPWPWDVQLKESWLKEVSSFQGYFCTHLHVAGTSMISWLREMSSLQHRGVIVEGFHWRRVYSFCTSTY